MALRMIEIVVSSRCADQVVGALAAEDLPRALATWVLSGNDERTVIKLLVDAENTEDLTDRIAQSCSGAADLRIVLLPVEATLPRVEEPEPDPAAEKPPQVGRVSREELLADVADAAKLSRTFAILTVLSSLVAVIGLTRNSVAVIIGAMVIAPFLGPNVALALATALADFGLVWRSLRALVIGLAMALAIGAIAGILLQPSAGTPEIAFRTTVGWGDIALALASGAAGGLAYTTAVPTALVGVMVGVALLPPWVTFGMMMGAGHWSAALGALMLTVLNIACLNVSGVLTFVLQGVSPASRWEARRARTLSTVTLLIWMSVLAVVIALLVIQGPP